MGKTVIILRSTSGAGKSTFAEYITSLKSENYTIVCADDYFVDSKGNYNFNAQDLGKAHSECRQKFLNALSIGTELVVVANTNSKPSEFEFYEEAAKEFDYQVFFIVLEKRHNNNNLHNCPQSSIERQAQNIKNSLKLF